MWSHSQKGPQVLLLQWRPPASVPLGVDMGVDAPEDCKNLSMKVPQYPEALQLTSGQLFKL